MGRVLRAVLFLYFNYYYVISFFIAGKYGNGNEAPTPEELANRIINTYESELIVNTDIVESFSPNDMSDFDPSIATASTARHTKAFEVAHMCLDYRGGDMEGAISVLLKSQELLYAAQRCF